MLAFFFFLRSIRSHDVRLPICKRLIAHHPLPLPIHDVVDARVGEDGIRRIMRVEAFRGGCVAIVTVAGAHFFFLLSLGQFIRCGLTGGICLRNVPGTMLFFE